ncbi:glycoside hydrolase family 3 C-terminal domain-containing protein [Kineosporia babensis]|nr:glycoside hydrolase family 3 C-terminal domain-containing protein [Kineosporia babensis]
MYHNLLAELTLEEKVSLLTGQDFWSTRPIEKIGLKSIVFSDGPSGVRGQAWDERDPSVNLPSATALSASWDVDVARRYGQVLADEAQRKGVDVVLGPTINMHRTPLGGRHFEAFSEDPFLTAELAAAYVDGIQELGIGATPKHYLCNDFETDRYTVDVRVDERALREVYLLAFEKAVRESRAWLVMSSYNQINGATASENDLLESPLNDEWGFDGVLIGDWTGVRSVESARYSQDLAMPGPDGPWGEALVKAVEAGDIPLAAIDRKVLRLLHLAARCGALESVPAETPKASAGLDAEAFARAAASAGAVLLENQDLLPVEPTATKKIVVVGHSARFPRTQGGGSASVEPKRVVTPLEGVQAAFPGAEIEYLPGVLVENGLNPLPVSQLRNPVASEPGVHVAFLNDGNEIHLEERRASKLVWFGGDAPIERTTTLELLTSWTPDTSGEVRFGIATVGRVELYADRNLVLDTVIKPVGTDLGAALLAPPAHAVNLAVTEGQAVALRLVHTPPRKDAGLQNALGITFGLLPPEIDDDALIESAVAAARGADLVVVVVGSNKELEAEGAERDTLALPGRQDDLVAALAAANPRTVAVVNTGAPVLLPWAEQVGAVLQVWFGGQELGNAIGDLITGAAEPGGRLPTTWPANEQDVPIFRIEPVDGAVEYTEGIHVGYRNWLRQGVQPAYPFGHGLGYTTWQLDSLEAPREVQAAEDGTFTVSVRVANTGARAGKQVVQLYAARPGSSVERPVTWLVGFRAIELEPGTSAVVEIAVPTRSLAHYDGGWQFEPGAFRLVASTSLSAAGVSGSIALTEF